MDAVQEVALDLERTEPGWFTRIACGAHRDMGGRNVPGSPIAAGEMKPAIRGTV
jgi:hypothetical protein